MLSWLIFKNYLLSRRSGALVRIIAWHCILGIGMGVMALVIVLSVMNGFNVSIRGRMLSLEPHVVVQFKDRPGPEQEKKLTALVAKYAAVERVDRFESQDLILRSMDGVFGGAVAKGYEPEAMYAMMKRVWASAKHDNAEPLASTMAMTGGEVVLGVDLARSLGIFEGDDVVLIPPEVLLLPKGEVPHLEKYKVKSLISTQMPDVDSKLLFYNMNRGNKNIRSLSLETGFEVRLQNPYSANDVRDQLVKAGYQAQTWMERDTSLFFALKMESFAMTLFLSLAVLITSFSIVTVMVLLMNQKRQDIGMFMALGLSLKRTRSVFFRVGLLLSFVGILCGIVLGSGICLFLDWYPLELLPDIYTDSTLPAKLTWRIFMFVSVSSSLIAVLGSWLPVWRYVALHPAESLRKPAGVNF